MSAMLYLGLVGYHFTAMDRKQKILDIIEKIKSYFVSRFKQFTPMRYIGCVCLLLVGVICFMYAVMFSVDMSKGIPFFTDADGNALTGYEVGTLVCFYLLAVFLLAVFVFETFIQKIPDKKERIEKDIVGGRVVEVQKQEKIDLKESEHKVEEKTQKQKVEEKQETSDIDEADLSKIGDILNEDKDE